MEIWKDCVTSNFYEVSSFGNIRDKETKCLLKLRYSSNGYVICGIRKGLNDRKQKMLSIHREVAKAFIENPFLYNQINHKDGNKTNNNVENLEWCNQSQNMKHAYKIGLEKSDVERLRHLRDMKIKVKFKNGQECEYSSIKEACEKLSINRKTLYNIIHKRFKNTRTDIQEVSL